MERDHETRRTMFPISHDSNANDDQQFPPPFPPPPPPLPPPSLFPAEASSEHIRDGNSTSEEMRQQPHRGIIPNQNGPSNDTASVQDTQINRSAMPPPPPPPPPPPLPPSPSRPQLPSPSIANPVSNLSNAGVETGNEAAPISNVASNTPDPPIVESQPQQSQDPQQQQQPEDSQNEPFFVINTADSKIFKKDCGQSVQFESQPSLRNIVGYDGQLDRLRQELTRYLREHMSQQQRQGQDSIIPVKVHVSCTVVYDVIKKGEFIEDTRYHFSIKAIQILSADDIQQEVDRLVDKMKEQILDRRDRGSGYIFKHLQQITTSVCKMLALRGGAFLPSPPLLAGKKGVLNIKTTDEKCILDCLVAKLHPELSESHNQHRNRCAPYKKLRHEIDSDGITFPVTRAGIRQLERQNPQFSLNVFTYLTLPRSQRPRMKQKQKRKKPTVPTILPWLISKNRDAPVPVDLLLIKEAHGGFTDIPLEDQREHFVLITDLTVFTRAMNNQCTGGNVSEHRTCRFCLQRFTTTSSYETHVLLCGMESPQATTYPPAGSTKEFSADYAHMSCPYIGTLDFESCANLVQGPSSQPNPELLSPQHPKKYPWIRFKSEAEHAEECIRCTFTKPCQELHEDTAKLARLSIFSFGYKIHCVDPDFDFPLRVNQSPDASEIFLRYLKSDMTDLYVRLRRNNPMIISSVQEAEFQSASSCSCCQSTFGPNCIPVRDHNHQFYNEDGTNYRQPLCQSCNWTYYCSSFPLFAHNLTG